MKVDGNPITSGTITKKYTQEVQPIPEIKTTQEMKNTNEKTSFEWISADKDEKISKKMIQSAIDGMNQTVKSLVHTHVKFTLHPGTDKYYVKIINDSTGKVLREIPSKSIKFLY